MIELKKDFRKKGGYEYHQLYKNDRFAIYECTQTFDNGKTDLFYEIFKYRVNKPNNIMPDFYEVYPSDECFGNWAWCCSDYGSVVRVFENDIEEDISEYAKFFDKLRLQSIENKKPCNYEGTYKIDPHIKQGWMMYN